MSILSASQFLLSLALRLDRTKFVRALALMLGGHVAAPLAALALGRFLDVALAKQATASAYLAVFVAALLMAELMLGYFAHLDYFELGEYQETELRVELMDVVNRSRYIDHLDNPELSNDVALVREALLANRSALEAVLQLMGIVVQTAATVVILISLSSWLAVLPLVALPAVLISQRAQGVVERARQGSAEVLRMHQHVLEIATSVAAVKELRIFGAEAEIVRRQSQLWKAITKRIMLAQALGAALNAGGQILFAIGYAGAIGLVAWKGVRGQASVGDQMLVISLAVQLSARIAAGIRLSTLLRGTAETLARMHRLRAAAADDCVGEPHASIHVRAPLRSGIRLEGVSFSYRGAQRPVLDNVSFEIRAGKTLALVGENGAGKSTLVKLLCGLYAPTAGRVCVDGVDLKDIEGSSWRSMVASLFQDFTHVELALGESVGIGSIEHAHDEQALRRAIAVARAERVLAAVPGGLTGVVGRGYANGTELSGGQWQSVALARCAMRDAPMLMILDEPAAALDPIAEQGLFERYASAANSASLRSRGATVLVTHRFSTVTMADWIVVLERGRVAEQGTHRQLMARNGQYAELFRLQARGYG